MPTDQRYFLLDGHEVVPTNDVRAWGQMFEQPELIAVPAPTQVRPGRCRVPTRYGAERRCT